MNKLDALWQYQQAELEADKLENKLKSTPARQKLNKLFNFLKEQQNAIAGIQKTLDSRQQAVDKLQAQIDELAHKYELELGEFKIMLNDDECTAEEMTESRRNVERIMKKAEAAKRELYDAMAQIEKSAAEYKETYAKAAKAKKEYDAARSECEQEAAAAKPDIDKAKAAANEAAKAVDAELLARYKRIKGRYAVPMAKVENNQCSGCNMSLPQAPLSALQRGKALLNAKTAAGYCTHRKVYKVCE